MPYLIYTSHVIVANSYPVLVLFEEVNCIDWIDLSCMRSLTNIHDSCWATEGQQYKRGAHGRKQNKRGSH